ncbi:pyridoxamine 5'-phosphate oxidase family protein [Prauserella alba]|uniref:Pyridoxamine 5'-phosphate oxidase N-terminal domain-containing protein n=1 Tax=Prauserella alba TaxID=176898 RepID=A0ABP4GCM7_9PSEU|nr:pyridoxamine 5'-phosphate oxidase family protein [Prauserella alba]MCP2183775.1 Pyridoxamine 5'-phosphate oxidase [Prauserella alba]
MVAVHGDETGRGGPGGAAPPPVGTRDLEDLRGARLTADARAELLATQTECTFVFTAEDGASAAVVLSFAYDDGRFWFTSVDGRTQVRGVDRDPRACVVVSNAGTDLAGRRMLSVRGEVTVHRDPAAVADLLPILARRLAPEGTDRFLRLLSSPRRVVLELAPTEIVASHDSRRMAGDGRGGPNRE